MGLFNFLKKIIREEQNKTETSLEEIKKEINDKSNELKVKANQIIAGIIPLLEECLIGLKSVNLEKRRENEQLKEIVKENLQMYIFYLEKFIDHLKNLDQTNGLDNYLARINTIFNSFTKNSAKIYQKATILIGKELEKVKEILKNFTQEYNLIIKENQKDNLRRDKLKKSEERFNEVANIEKVEEQIRNILLNLNSKKKKNQEEIAEKIEEKNKIIDSPNYKKDLEEKQRVSKEINELEREIAKTMEKINLKELARKYHNDEKKHRIIQNYRENYKRAIEDDKEKSFEKIIKESLNLDINLTEINEKIKELKKCANQSEIKIKNIEQEIQALEREINEVDKNKKEEEKKLEKFKNEKEEVINSLKSEIKI